MSTLSPLELNGLDAVAADLLDFGRSVGLDFQNDSGLIELMDRLVAAGRVEAARWLSEASVQELTYLFYVLQRHALVKALTQFPEGR